MYSGPFSELRFGLLGWLSPYLIEIDLLFVDSGFVVPSSPTISSVPMINLPLTLLNLMVDSLLGSLSWVPFIFRWMSIPVTVFYP